MTRGRSARRLAWVGAVAGISIISPYVLAVLARRFPNSAVATLHAGIVKGES
jgi:hypothetical protein